ncbi:winged helix DNA-binding domain-containing protein [Actinomadura sp. ATCC 31491]|uniref:Winged helix DNA-binding domain-containing protein n=1 Tax=Actinomadura luzonensis TaxID=2805427 RepID=A0ABT0FIX3_9ACTN|nr:winged helix DNA-binding domain-containing protein [Actinomadura luzonensis]MCK2212257.1 winged helix DNA-binding domain-containing protein [Actinomadura luzonensis]
MALSLRELNRATLARQLLLRREPLDAGAAVRRLVALQAQQPASPYLALWNRLSGFDPAGLDAAFADGSLVKATLMRITLHVVHADDHTVLRLAMRETLRASRLGDRRFAATGLTPEQADALVPELLAFADRPRTGAEIEAWAAERAPRSPKGVLRVMRSIAPLLHAPTGGAWSFGPRPSYLAASPDDKPGDTDACLQELVLRYLEAFGPASVLDVAQYAMVYRPRARAALAALADRLERLEGPGGTELFDVPGAPRPPAGAPAPPRLMAMWDNVLLAYADRARVIPPGYRQLVIRANGDVLPTLLVDGHVAGVWRPVPDGIEATAFHRLPGEAWHGLAAEAKELLALLAGREPAVYSRYGRWWDGLPAAEVRVLPG